MVSLLMRFALNFDEEEDEKEKEKESVVKEEEERLQHLRIMNLLLMMNRKE